ncbi:hypothetical protein HRbin40_01431 [bacterium HR40]|nr:hypothetical protein HRbin40_01431 [bacterium HR40]
MRRALVASALLHLAAGALLWMSFGRFPRPLPEATVMAVEVVSEAPAARDDKPEERPAPQAAATAPLPERDAAAPPPPPPTVTEPGAAEPAPPPPSPPMPDPLAAAQPAPVPEPVRKPEATPTPPPTPAPAPTPKPEPQPQPTPRKAEAEPAPKPAPRPQPQAKEPPQPSPLATPDVVPRPLPRPQPSAKQPTSQPPPEQADVVKPDPLDALLRSVEEVAERRRAEEKREGRGSAPAAGRAATTDGTAGPAQAQLAGLQRMIEEQIYRCWIVPVGASDLSGARVVLRFSLAPDGTVRSMDVVDRERFARDPVFRAVAESAIRAVQRCSPLRLPADQYAWWRDIEMNFDPARALSG